MESRSKKQCRDIRLLVESTRLRASRIHEDGLAGAAPPV
jgi:hypothetical protein